ncbi:hypothetical protein BE18_47120 [Sorangium cellulosum]|uniref:Secreted protein n=1 Tax=Sorangium cellulosum TaxID=56 RepID=A0A150SB87_SORCE|nr:hypothetical protein BE18_47120 [Sorangium cellulosum]
MVQRVRTLLVLLLLLACPRVAWAQRVLVVRPPPRDSTLFEAFGRLCAELALQSFEVIVLESPARSPGAEELERKAQESEAFAAVALRRDGSGTAAEVCIADRVTGKTTTRKLLIDPSSDGPMLLAVRAVDLLRASLLELGSGEAPAPDVLGVEARPPAPEVLRFSQEPLRFHVRTGGLVLLAPPIGGGVGVQVGAHYRLDERLRLGLLLGGPLLGAEFRAGGGAAEVRQELALLRAGWNLGRAAAGVHWEWGPLLGIGAYHLQATGNVALPLVGRTEQFFSFAADAGLSVQYFFHPRVSLGLELTCLTLLPRPVIAVDDERSAPLAAQALGTLSLGASF